jgi:aryl-alcohol dehydrogenase-like predicted oxidoreductase
MEHRTLGSTGIEVSEIGFGAWAIGGDAWGPVEDEASVAAMRRALELGITFLDTADVYGDGHSEELVAQVIQGRREDVIVATKGGLVGHHRDPSGPPVYDRPEKVREALENSLRRLGTDYVDVYFDHIWWDSHEETEVFIAALAQLKAEGKARAVGVSTDDLSYIQHFADGGGLDVVQLEYSVLNRKAEQEVLPYLQERGIGVVVRGPLQKGLLTGKFTPDSTFPEGDIRADWPSQDWYQADLRRVESLRELDRDGRTIGQAALQFVLSHPAVSTAIPGGKTPQQVAANAAASVRPLLSTEELQLIDQVAPMPS